MGSPDNRELFAEQLEIHMKETMERLNKQLSRDKVLVQFDAIALEAIRLNVPSWDQLTVSQLREKIIEARAKEKKEIAFQEIK